MVNGCEFCSKIWNNVKEYKESFEFEHQEEIAIVTDSHGPGYTFLAMTGITAKLL